MLKHAAITEARIERFVRNQIWPALWQEQVPLAAAIHQPSGQLAPADAPAQAFAPVEPGHAWGPVWSDAWFRFTGAIPEGWRGRCVVARLDCGAEAIVWSGDDPLQGVDGNHGEFRVSRAAEGGEAVTLFVRANGMNPNVSCDAKPVDPPAKPFRFGHALLAVYDEELWALFHDLRVAGLVMREQPADSPRRSQLLRALNAVVNAWDAADRSTIALCRRIVAEAYHKPAAASAHEIGAIGHAHIDTAWLWPVERTHQKCIHTFATTIGLMDDYPEYRFVCSQAQHYAWIKEMAPKLYERIREKVRSGQWEINGAMWVEADCNISGGEALVRQVLHGKRYWMQEFGVETDTLWLPDVFGYSAALPQILQKAGVPYFLTQKISWNQTNRFPHHTFWWQGIDGTRVFTHFPPADTYNGNCSPRELAFSARNFRDHDRARRSLYVYGFGDGGGGPTIEMLESLRRLEDIDGMPRVRPQLVSEFFAQALAEADDAPLWVGELYLELHRGTYTTQGRSKRNNRLCEFLLRDAEYLACVSPAGLAAYPADTLDQAWKTILTTQFHDIIPGSSVREVYEDSDRDYAEVMAAANGVIDGVTEALASDICTEGLERPVLVVRNYDDWAYGETVELELPEGDAPRSVRYMEADVAPAQVTDVDGRRVALFRELTCEEGHGYAVYDLSDEPVQRENPFTVTERVLDNGLLRVHFDENGLIERIWDSYYERDVVAQGEKANQLQLFEDRPLFWDAWDIDIYYQEKGRVLTELESVEVIESGPVRGAVRFTRRFGASTIVQTVRIAAESRRLEFVTDVDWHEEYKLLKAAFPVAINAAKAKYEIQWGHVERPTHYNTSWDQARFEVAAQKWADLSEGGYGVALLNDGRYGHDAFGHTLRLTLLRSPKAPDPEADMGRHRFTYALLPHSGDVWTGQVVEQAYHLNAPPRARLLTPGRPGSLPPEQIFFDTDREGTLIEAIKKAEDEAAIIVRLYEAYNSRGHARLRTSLRVRSAHRCDLLERDEEELPVEDGVVSFDIQPFEIVTIKLRLA
ncbi:MAG TPA: alpha-mannosidase [Chthonomonadales bacterium]|nr:alpha-mannosidase [Chthonomonadales bacterium]